MRPASASRPEVRWAGRTETVLVHLYLVDVISFWGLYMVLPLGLCTELLSAPSFGSPPLGLSVLRAWLWLSWRPTLDPLGMGLHPWVIPPEDGCPPA